MTKPKKNGLRLDADFTEDLVGFALESFLAVMSFPRQRFSIEPFSRGRERWLGADARLLGQMRGFRPFYMQFKRPSAYPDYSTARIIKDRKKLRLQTAPRTLYFDLREKQDHHWDFQHNILFRLHKRLRSRKIGDAAYVCPLFLERSAYRLNLHWSGVSLWPHFWRRHPWDFEEVWIRDNGKRINFDRMPVLAEHITVPPHQKVSSARHRYSFTEAGQELCFHSPEALPEGAESLFKFLSALSGSFLDDGEKIQPQQANEELKSLMSAALGDGPEAARPDFEINADDPIGNWFAWGDYLRTKFGIEQYAFVRWMDD
jgi:hypothetical protein